ncbi:hypothetical protein H2204_002998 [Knufia peltigerae]|uniref:MmgE/PrpD family protein n=1 Tax=Knufia peltigerae TaxID=1002370 RepID=A0AA38YAE9_9EURO|nr:hypothetical protein H2204_002998 [Knufia peltigerae]
MVAKGKDMTLEAIADFVVKTQEEEPPSDAIAIATHVLLDTLACVYAGMQCPGARAAASISDLPCSPKDAGTVIGSTEPTTVEMAAFWNSCMLRYADTNDSLTAGHPSDMLGPLIAIAGARETSGPVLLKGIAVAYEVFHLLMLHHRGYHKHKGALVDNLSFDQGFFMATGAAAGIACMLKYDHTRTKTAVSLAGCNGLPLRAGRAGELSNYKGVATAVSSRAAVFSCQLAEAGLTGPSHPFEGRHGYIEIMEGKAGPMKLQPFGTWAVKRTNFKYFPSTANTQIAIWCAKELREELDVSQVREIMLHTSRFLWHESGSEPAKWAPMTHETADHSLPYTFTMGLLDGNVNLETYSDEMLASDRWRTLIKKIKVQVDDKFETEWPEVIQIRATVTMADGSTKEHYSRDPKGHWLNPFSREDIRAKFKNLAYPILGSSTDSIFDHAETIAESKNCKTFFEVFATKSTRVPTV